MEYILSERTKPYPSQTVTALGFFDGIHIGHMALLRETVRLAQAQNATPAVFTFADIPSKPKQKLCTKEDWLSRMKDIGIEVIFLADFSDLKDQSPQEFVKNTLQTRCHALHAVCGFNFHFGKGACADADTLTALMPCTVMPPVMQTGAPVSSSRIREALKAGQVEEVAAMLGRPYALTAPVLHGKALGRQHGIPTANMRPSECLPQNGVYITSVCIDGVWHPALTDIGTRPTVEGGDDVRLETHIPHITCDLYGRKLTVLFHKRLRGEMRFADATALFAQIERDLSALRLYTEKEYKDGKHRMD